MRHRDRLLWAAGILVVGLVAVRIALPEVIEDYVNRKLRALEAYDGYVMDVDLALWRGAYRIEGVRIVKTGMEESTPFFSAPRIEFSIEWRNLLRGALVAEGVFYQPNLNLVQGPDEKRSQTGKEVDWEDRIAELFPFRFNTVRVVDGTVTFRAPGIRTQDALKATDLDAVISNLTNVEDVNKETFATFRATARVLDGGSARIAGSIDPLAKNPTFDVNLEVRGVQLPQVNPWLRQYIKADAERGSFELYTELAAADGKFRGYAKPIMHNVQILSSEPEDSALRKLWEGLVEFAKDVLENEDEKGNGQVAARVPFSGTIENPEAGIFATVVSVLRNAFVSAFARSLEGSISLRSAKESLRDIGGSNGGGEEGERADENEEKEEKKKDEEEEDPQDALFGPKQD